MSYWSLFDQYNNAKANYSEMMQTGLWMSAKEEYSSETWFDDIKEDFQCRPQYYAYSLMTKYIKQGADIYPLAIDEDYISGTAFLKDGKYVIVLANGSQVDKKYSIANISGNYNVYSYEKDNLPSSDSLIESSDNLSVKNKCLSFMLPKNSAVVLTQS
jgi:alpha-galactosidase